MEIPILFEDESLLVINKPAGVVVNRAQTVKGETVQDWAESYLSSRPVSRDPEKEANGFQVTCPPELTLRRCGREPGMTDDTAQQDFFNRSGIVHRIDKETSGILLIAKTPEAFITLQRQFKERMVKKTYLAIAHGKLVPPEGEIRAPVGRLPWNRERFGIVPGGKEAVTRYAVIRQVNSGNPGDSQNVYSLVELYPETGRTHQIRIHLKYINHPILGDYLYAGRKTSRDDRLWAPRVMLHAWKLVCAHPQTGKTLAFEAPIPDDMNRIIHGSS